MKNAGNGQVSRVLFGLFLGLLLAGPVFGNEPAPTDASAPAAQVEEKKVEAKVEKRERKGKRRHHKSKKAAEAKVEKEAVSTSSPEAEPQEVSPEMK